MNFLHSWFRSDSVSGDMIKVSKEDMEKLGVQTEKPVTAEAMPVTEEKHFSFKKRVLYLYLGILYVAWNDVFSYFLGWLGWSICFVFCMYALVLCYPNKIGKWDPAQRLQIRSVFIVQLGIVSIYVIFPVWWLWVADARWFPTMTWLAPMRTLTLVYVAWYTFFDHKASKTGGRVWPMLRKRRFWKHFASYFPMRLTRTAKLDPKKNYIFGYHPHGVLSLGAVINFGTSATGFDQLYPGIDMRVLTLEMNFKLPFVREYLMATGMNDASKESIMNNLSRGEGSSVMLVIGGAAESIDSGVGKNELTLASRKGFVKLALKQGASLVPVYSFGENDMYASVEVTGKAAEFQKSMQKKLGFAIPFFYGRALTGGLLHRLFGCKRGTFPFRIPVHSITGRPIDCPKTKEEDLTDALLDEYHGKYVAELKKIYEDWKDVYAEEKKARLEELEQDADRKKLLESEGLNIIHTNADELKIK